MSSPEQRQPATPDGGTEKYVAGASKQTDMATSVTAYLLAGPLGFGVTGWALDSWLDTRFCLPVGVLVGMGLSLYVVWLRYGRA